MTERPGTVILIGNGLSIGASRSFLGTNLTREALEHLPAESLAFVQRLAGLSTWDIDSDGHRLGGFEELAGPIDHLAEILRALPGAGDSDLRGIEPALRREYKRLVACVLRSVVDAGEPPWPPQFEPGESREEINARLALASPTAGELRPFAQALYAYAERHGSAIGSPLTSVFTLIYDSLLERALLTFAKPDKKRYTTVQRTMHLGFGIDGSVIPIPALDGHMLEVQHLHGCVYWVRENNVIRWEPMGTFVRILQGWRKGRNEHLDPVVILGNHKTDLVERTPFRETYEYFRRRLAASRVCIVAGYGFGDAPVNRLLAEFMQQDGAILHLWCLDPREGTEQAVKALLRDGATRLHVHPRSVTLPDPSAFEELLV